MHAAMNPRPARRALLRYSALALPLAFAGLPVYLHAPDFYARELQISLVSIGLSLLALRLIDAVQDPLIGSLSDRFAHHRPRIVQLGAALLAAGFWMIFHPLERAPLVWFAASIFLCTTGFSIVSINLNTLGGLWRVPTGQRTRITGWREAFGLVGLLAAAALPPLLGSDARPAAAFHQLSLVFLLLLAGGLALFFRWLRDAARELPDAPRPAHLWDGLPLLFAGVWERHFFGVYLLSAAASALPAVLVLFFIRDRLEAEAFTGLFLMLYFLSGALGMPLWQRLAARFGKHRCWGAGMALAVLVFVWAFTLERGDAVFYGLICMLSGLALGADLALPPAMLADRLAARGVQAHASASFALLSFLTKTALVLATGISLPVLGLLGYQPGQVEDYAVTVHLSVAYALVPCAMKILAAFWLWGMPERPQEGGAAPDDASAAQSDAGAERHA